jgi:hypothetical protein
MSQLLASLEDIEEFTNATVSDELVAPIQVQVYRVIRSELSPKYSPVVLAGWRDPEHTPVAIREIAGKMIAAHLYGDQGLYQEALDDLKELANGTG